MTPATPADRKPDTSPEQSRVAQARGVKVSPLRPGIEEIRLNIRVVRVCDLPVPPPKEAPPIETGQIGAQTTLFDLTPPLLQPQPIAAPEQTAKPEVIPDATKLESTQDTPGPGAEASNQHEAYSTYPTSVRESDEGHVEGKTAGENTAKT